MEITVTEQFAQQLEILNQQLTELNQSNLVVRLKRLEDDTEYLKSVPHLIAIIVDTWGYPTVSSTSLHPQVRYHISNPMAS